LARQRFARTGNGSRRKRVGQRGNVKRANRERKRSTWDWKGVTKGRRRSVGHGGHAPNKKIWH